MDKEKLKQWLLTEGRDRQWLAEQLGSTKGSVDQWFSRGFPDWAAKSIERMMSVGAPPIPSAFEVTFTAAEFEQIEQARKLLGIASRKNFYEEAINAYAAEIIAREGEEHQSSLDGKIAYFPPPNQSNAAAEEPHGYSSLNEDDKEEKPRTKN